MERWPKRGIVFLFGGGNGHKFRPRLRLIAEVPPVPFPVLGKEIDSEGEHIVLVLNE